MREQRITNDEEREALERFVGVQWRVSGTAAARLADAVLGVFKIIPSYYNRFEAEEIAAVLEEYARARAPELARDEGEQP